MSQQSTINLNILQNKEDFELEPISKQLPIFKLGLIKKTLDSFKAKEKKARIQEAIGLSAPTVS